MPPLLRLPRGVGTRGPRDGGPRRRATGEARRALHLTAELDDTG